MNGWTTVRVTSGIERCPSDFDIEFTELYPGQPQALIVQPGDACRVMIDNGESLDLVITGYVDRFIPSITATTHSLRVLGRSKCQDLVDCAAEWPNSQITGSSVLTIAQDLAKPYGIAVSANSDVGGPIPQFNIMLGDSAFEIIERISRYRGLLAHDTPDGNLVLERVSTTPPTSAIVQGINVLAASITYAMDQRFSEYDVFLQSMDVLSDLGQGGNQIGKAFDPNVKRNRKRYIIAEAGGGGMDVAIQRGLWEAARRAGRGKQVYVVTDDWRDAVGKLWTPNTLVNVDLPALKLENQTLCIGEVTFRRDGDNGTTAELMLMPPDAFLPQPILLQPFPADVPAGLALLPPT